MSDLDFESKFDKYKNVNLAIEGSAIIPNDRFKEEYAKVIRNNLDEFNNILNKKSEQARHIFNYEIKMIIDKRNMETVKGIK